MSDQHTPQPVIAKTRRHRHHHTPAPVIGNDDELLTIQEVADVLRVDASTVRRWASTGALGVVILPHANKRRVYRVPKSVVEKLLSESTAQGGAI